MCIRDRGFPPMSFIPGLRDEACDAYIKRVVALPGEIVSVNIKGEVIVNNQINLGYDSPSNFPKKNKLIKGKVIHVGLDF